MADGDHRALEGVQIILQHVQRLNVQIVGGLVQQQHVGRGHQHAQQIQPALLAARQGGYLLILHAGGKQKGFGHLRGGKLAVGCINAHGHIAHRVDDACVGIKRRAMLGKHTQAHGFAHLDDAAVRRQLAAEQAQQRGFACAVAAHNAHAVVPQQGVGKVPHQRAAA